MLKVDMQREINSLSKQLEEAKEREKALLVVMAARYVSDEWSNKKYLALPLTQEELDRVKEAVENQVYRSFEGSKRMSIEIKELLPQFNYYHVRIDADDDNNIFGMQIWGMVEVK
jgi:hypothetical protein